MAAIIIVGSGMLIGYVSSKIFTNYVKTNNNEFTESIDDKFINIEMRKLGLVSEKEENLLKMEEGKLNNYTVNVKGNNFDSFASTNSYNKEICC
jgi:hypothetical protein